ncbi:IAA-alanine resistance protein 1 isoform X2 [Cucurbita pepo subsp. pepo]|uniref:IAA-alanine resistance protein 1 isoform X2 n=1 Tax=Cucurbita pepo subsp. pepo TaxID=3664 RepID=UPI000C9D5D7F|nr:IAA-alanine resistance protein 1 isoform X2 [Cucurbita pepo subsp. pepo]
MPNRNLLLLISASLLLLGFLLDLTFAHASHGHHHCTHAHGDHSHSHAHDHHDHDHHHHHHRHGEDLSVRSKLLPEELAEEEDMKLFGFGRPYINVDHQSVESSELSGLWVRALGCSLLISMASLICLVLLPVIFVRGKPSKGIVDSLALFGAGAMLGDAFLHQLPHAFGGDKHSHSHADHQHHGHSGENHSHAHSLEDLSVGISVLAGIVLFLLVEKVVRYVEDNSAGGNEWSHGHHHHHNNKKWKDDSDYHDTTDKKSKAKLELDAVPNNSKEDKVNPQRSIPQKRIGKSASRDVKQDLDAANGTTADVKTLQEFPAKTPSNLVFGYLNLFSDGVHNFTDGMALGSAFLLYGSVGGWSRTVFLLAHELPQEIGDFGILVRSGFSVVKALFFNFLSALVALAGTALALLMGKDPGHSSLIEGFTAGGFIYIAVAGVLAEMNSNSKPTVRTTALQLTSLVLGMAVALGISLVE